MKIISPRAHGVLDYLVVILFLAAPGLFGFIGVPATVAYLLAAAHLLLTLATNFPLGVVKLIPLPVHGVVEISVAVVLLLLPWLAGFAGVPAERNFYLVMGVLIGASWLLTDYAGDEAPE